MTDMIIMRHGNWNYKDDKILEEEWTRASQEVRPVLEEEGFKPNIVLSSDVNRAIETAKALGFRYPIVPEKSLAFEEGCPLQEFYPRNERDLIKQKREQLEVDLVGAIFAIDRLRRELERRSRLLLAFISEEIYRGSFGSTLLNFQNPLIVTHGVTLTGLCLTSKRKKNWNSESYKGNRFRPFEMLILRPEYDKHHRVQDLTFLKVLYPFD